MFMEKYLLENIPGTPKWQIPSPNQNKYECWKIMLNLLLFKRKSWEVEFFIFPTILKTIISHLIYMIYSVRGDNVEQYLYTSFTNNVLLNIMYRW